ncbi:RNA polymerase factor sigma-54 [Porphyromonas crevioricanis]|uniref:RNA polymerase factor sigma-54 n=1 Tax=Porphyromonas crevioricanis TaxID=393921 RepID=A0A2X4PGK9_9PORP|nr:RNA polymerase factor sigma-54 [Porphyromonas crevioricanis]GAD07134.1 RNA polymerase sigma-54 factor RpoN [Porphyromonas crevioricanis JCM 13913]SQH73024.1 RNA polymerase factor sigma-54 [Porphyromonas crevioricanis]
MLKNRLQQQLEQSLSARQIQQIKLLELPMQELELRIKKEIEDNPALELEDSIPERESSEQDVNEEDLSLDDYRNEDDIPGYKLRQIQDREARNDNIPFAASAETASQQLLGQLELLPLTDRQRSIAPFVIGSIDSDGYLRRSAVDLSDDLIFNTGISASPEELASVIDLIKTLDPPGIAAADLRECMLLQLQRIPPDPKRDLALVIIRDYFDDFANKHFDRLTSLLDISPEELAEASRLIVRLNPKPGNALAFDSVEEMQQIRPDFVVTEDNGVFSVSMPGTRELPVLKINPEYVDMARDYKASAGNRSRERRETLLFVKHKMERAKWFIEAIRMRQETLLNTMRTIVSLQADYFRSGEISDLKPMILKDVADLAGFDVSTISRIVSGKYVETDFGIFSLKHFFSSAMTTDEGDEISNMEVMAALKTLIEKEDKRHPLSDQALTRLLEDKGYRIARRTVAKYRQRLGFPTGRMRREIL